MYARKALFSISHALHKFQTTGKICGQNRRCNTLGKCFFTTQRKNKATFSTFANLVEFCKTSALLLLLYSSWVLANIAKNSKSVYKAVLMPSLNFL